MAVESNVIQTIFRSIYQGGGAVRQAVKDIGLAEKATERYNKAIGKQTRTYGEAQMAQKAFDANRKRVYEQLEKGKLSSEQASKALDGLAENTKLASGSFANLGKSIPPVALAAGGLALGVGGVALALKKLYPIAEEGAGLAQLEKSFNRLNASVLKTPDLMNDMIAASNRTITSASAMEGFLTLTAGASDELSQAFAKNAPQLMNIAKAANVLNPTLGDTNYMFNSLARGIKRSEVRLLDNLGLNIKVAEANKKYAASLGITVKEMSAADKQMALLNETILVGNNLIKQVGGSTESLTDPYMQLSAAWGELRNQMKMGLSQAYPAGGPEGLAKTLSTLALSAQVSRQITEIRRDGNEELLTQDMLLKAAARDYKTLIELAAELQRVQQGITDEEQKKRELGTSIFTGFGPRESDAMPFAPGMGAWDKYVYELTKDWFDLSAAAKGYMETQEDAIRGANSSAVAGGVGRVLKDAQKDAEEAAKATEKAMKEAMAAYDEYLVHTGDVFTEMRNADREGSLFTRTIDEIGKGWTTVGGRTEEQNKLLEDFQDAQERSLETIRDYEVGLKGWGEKEETVTKRIDAAREATAHYTAQIARLEGIQGELVETETRAIWNWENVDKALYNASDSAGATAWQMSVLGYAIGDLSKEQGVAALKAAAMQIKIEEVAQAYKDGLIGPDGAIAAVRKFGRMLDQEEDNIAQILEPETVMKGISERGYDRLEESLKNDEAMLALYPTVNTGIAEDTIDKLFAEREPDIIKDVDIDDEKMRGTLTAVFNDFNNKRLEWALTVAETKGFEMNQSGGRVYPYQSYMVGESGPERFIPDSPGTILPAGESGGGGDTYVFNNYGAGAVAMARTIARNQSRRSIDKLMGVSS